MSNSTLSTHLGYDNHLYKYRPLVESAFMQLKTWRDIVFLMQKDSVI
ncbi:MULTISPECIES: hypothetical protein [unclassified Acinetobacter]|nr:MULTISPECIES: hypothetical protein [unclassified Acinetobacter]